MNIEELKLIQETLMALSGNATVAFISWLVAKYVLGNVLLTVFGISAIYGAVKAVRVFTAMEALRSAVGAGYLESNLDVVERAVSKYKLAEQYERKYVAGGPR